MAQVRPHGKTQTRAAEFIDVEKATGLDKTASPGRRGNSSIHLPEEGKSSLNSAQAGQGEGPVSRPDSSLTAQGRAVLAQGQVPSCPPARPACGSEEPF